MLEELERILRCPQTGGELVLQNGGSHYRAKDSGRLYPIVDGIIDFLPDHADRLTEAYDAAAGAYDSFLTGSNLLTRLYNLFVWGITDDSRYAKIIVDCIPDDFCGVLLDVPAGTGVFTEEKYSRLTGATILGVDYSMGMLRQAKARFAARNMKHVALIRADVEKLPLSASSVDAVITMNGIHAFPRKVAAVRQMSGALKGGGRFMGCTYVKGNRIVTDAVVHRVYARRGWFAKPFFTEEQLTMVLREVLASVKKTRVKSIVVFEASK
jgi:SAM-dependent methyltransferase